MLHLKRSMVIAFLPYQVNTKCSFSGDVDVDAVTSRCKKAPDITISD